MEILMKICSSCHQKKAFDFYHKDKNTNSGYSTYCKSCKKEKDKIRQKTRVLNKDVWRKKFPERKNAHAKVFRALVSGKLIKQPCLMCGESAEAHHPDYSRPLDVVWLCQTHHKQVHLLLE